MGIDWVTKTKMSDVILRHHPELEPALEGLPNAFLPWHKVDAGAPAGPIAKRAESMKKALAAINYVSAADGTGDGLPEASLRESLRFLVAKGWCRHSSAGCSRRAAGQCACSPRWTPTPARSACSRPSAVATAAMKSACSAAGSSRCGARAPCARSSTARPSASPPTAAPRARAWPTSSPTP